MIDPLSAAILMPKPAAPSKSAAVGKDFEALLVAQMLKGMHGSGGWLSSGEDQSMDAAVGFAEEQLSRAFTAGGGFGLAKLVDSGINRKA